LGKGQKRWSWKMFQCAAKSCQIYCLDKFEMLIICLESLLGIGMFDFNITFKWRYNLPVSNCIVWFLHSEIQRFWWVWKAVSKRNSKNVNQKGLITFCYISIKLGFIQICLRLNIECGCFVAWMSSYWVVRTVSSRA
jgi:hypothetical protein